MFDAREEARAITARINPDRLADDLWALVNIPSPTGQERQASLAFARMLARAGAQVQLDERNPSSPTVIGRLQGTRPGKVFQLAGHIDHIDVSHRPPKRTREIISGRGSADMKNGLAGILEIVRVLHECGCNFPGQVLVTVYGLHEAPIGDSASLLRLINEGTVGEAALVAENVGPAEGQAVIMGKGQSIWTIRLAREGAPCHELCRPEGEDLLGACLAVASVLHRRSRELSRRKGRFPLLGPESLFVGQVHYGDFYNRMPQHCTLQGTRRWLPRRTFGDVQQEMARLLASVPLPPGISVESDWTFVAESYQMAAKEPVVRAFKSAGQTVTGRHMKDTGISAVVDGHRLVALGRVPTVLCGFDNVTAHADLEFVRLEKLLDPCKIALLTTLNYLYESERRSSEERP
ncbi:MAG: M20 family metallopeptidase [Acidobacteriota bacterium]